LPIDGSSRFVAGLFPRRDFIGQLLYQRDTSTDALTGKDADFDFGHVQPATMFGCVMDLQLVRNPKRFRRLERLIERAERMRIQVVHHQDDLTRLGIPLVDQLANAMREIKFRSLVGYFDMSPTGERSNIIKILAVPQRRYS